MHPTTYLVLTLAGIASVAARGGCDAQNVLDNCIASTKPRLDACIAKSDMQCSCLEAQNLLTCYANCPDTDTSGVKAQKTSYCVAYSATATTTSFATPSSTAGSSSLSATKAGVSGASDDASSTSNTATPTGAAGAVGVPALLMGVAAVMGAFV